MSARAWRQIASGAMFGSGLTALALASAGQANAGTVVAFLATALFTMWAFNRKDDK